MNEPLRNVTGSTLGRLRLAGVLFLWVVAAAGGYTAMVRYELTPGQSAEGAGALWPVGSGLEAGNTTLVMAAHPGCPCSKASVAEMAELVAEHPGTLTGYVLFVAQPEAGVGAKEIRESDLWQRASEIQGVTCVVDEGRLATELFHARTSGQVMVYDAAGKLQFSGGITAARDHVGPNAGIDTISGFLATGKMATHTTPVFGCALR